MILPDGSIERATSYEGILARGTQSSPGTGFGVMKYLNESSNNLNSWPPTSDQDFIVFRYGETLLNLAEAAFELGKESEALAAINEIRERAGIVTLSSIDRDKIRHERKVELAFEGHRYWDVRRWRTATVDLSRDFKQVQYFLDVNSYKDPNSPSKYKVVITSAHATNPAQFREENYYLPITLARTANNPNLVENPGYE